VFLPSAVEYIKVLSTSVDISSSHTQGGEAT